MPRGVKTDEKKVMEILSSYAITNSYNATAKECHVSDTTVKSVVERNNEEFGKIKEQKREEFVEYADRLIYKALDKLDSALDKKDIPINSLTTAIGTLYDKKALASGGATANNKFDVEVRVIE